MSKSSIAHRIDWVLVGVAVIVVGLMLGQFIAGIAGIVDALVTPVHSETYNLPPCITDGDEANCYWDADTMGNGKGESYILLNGIQYHAG